MKIIVTGGAGFIGSNLCLKLLDLGHTVVAIDNLDPYYFLSLKNHNLQILRNRPNFTFEQVDVLDQHHLDGVFKKTEPEVVVHLAAKAGVRNSIRFPESYFKVNVLGSLNVLQLSRKYKVSKVVVASSSSVYGENENVPFSENDRTDSQVSPYAASKKSLEIICKTFHQVYGLPIQILRFFTVYGPSGRPDMAPAIFSNLIENDKPITVFGSVETERDYTYVDDIVDGIVAAISVKDKFEIYNLGNDKPVKLKRLIHYIEVATNKTAQIETIDTQAGDVSRTWANIEKAVHRLGYQPKVSLEVGIEKFVKWYLQHQDLYKS
jgi:UDP-glucuronate 4-epimerase